MKNFKSILLGITIGAILTCGISVIADNIYNVIENPYPISVDGNVKHIEGYNINDSTYFKLRDIGEQVGFDVAFDEGVITILTNNTQQANTTVITTPSTLFSLQYQVIDGVEYVSDVNLWEYINDTYARTNWMIAYTTSEPNPSENWYELQYRNGINIIERYNIPTIYKDGNQYISREVVERDVIGRITGEIK